MCLCAITKPVIHDRSTPRNWSGSIFQPTHLGRPFMTAPRNGNPVTPMPSDFLGEVSYPKFLAQPPSTPSHTRSYTRRCLFIARQSKWSGGYLDWLVIRPSAPHRTNSHRFRALTTGFGEERSNFRGVELS
ncbi:hypothetical protein AVEN_169073-1 [Araneus ventricosus]|uniref:Uncharacterized protein n=1 Tax=Araneus ventricosus TaxID=182803 RepID=A0A4Y2U6C2_ARAVE|nr:hypothetical protein AVEN_168914-1 [Araneus ventricosus]GBO08549.1 hypothetical protein AVEN_169073-1 [Araneus ventricosus]